MMQVSVNDKGIATITFDVNADTVESASGKTLLVASTYGGQVIGLNKAGQPVTLSLNAYIPNRK